MEKQSEVTLTIKVLIPNHPPSTPSRHHHIKQKTQEAGKRSNSLPLFHQLLCSSDTTVSYLGETLRHCKNGKSVWLHLVTHQMLYKSVAFPAKTLRFIQCWVRRQLVQPFPYTCTYCPTHKWSATCHSSPQAHLHMVGMFGFMFATELAHSVLFSSPVCSCLYGPFNCISFPKFSRQLSSFLTLFFKSYFCLIGPFNYLPLYESLLQP